MMQCADAYCDSCTLRALQWDEGVQVQLGEYSSLAEREGGSSGERAGERGCVRWSWFNEYYISEEQQTVYC